MLSVAFSADGIWLVSGGGNGEIKVWEGDTGRWTATLPGHGRAAVNALAFSPDGELIVSASADKTLKLWNRRTGGLERTFVGHEDSVRAVSFSPDGEFIASGGTDKSIRIWNTLTGAEVGNLRDPSSGIATLAYRPDGKQLVSGNSSGMLQVWNAMSGEQVRAWKGHTGSVSCIALSQNGQLVASVGSDNLVNVWDAESGRARNVFRGHTSFVTSVGFVGERIVSGSYDYQLKIWETKPPRSMRYLRSPNNQFNGLAISPDGKQVAGAAGSITNVDGVRKGQGSQQELMVWDVSSGQAIHSVRGHNGNGVSCVAFSPDGRRIVTGSYDTTLKVRDAATAEEVYALAGHKQFVLSAAYRPDGRQIASGDENGTIIIWDADSGEALFHLENRAPVKTLTYTRAGDRLVSARGPQMNVWDLRARQIQRVVFGHREAVTCLAFSEDGKWLATGSEDLSAKIWDVSDWRVVHTLRGHSRTEGFRGVSTVAFSPDGTRLVSGGRDKIIKVWSVASGLELVELRMHSWYVNGLAFSPDGRQLASASSSVALCDASDNYRRLAPLPIAKVSSDSLVRDGAFGFPQQEASVLCDGPELRLSAYCDADYLFLQAIVWKDGDDSLGKSADDLPLGDSSILMIDLDADGVATPQRDRMYGLNITTRLPGLRRSVVLSPNSHSPFSGDFQGRGCVSYFEVGESKRVRVDNFVIPLVEIERSAGHKIRLAYWATSPHPKFTMNSLGYELASSHSYLDLPVERFHELTLGAGPKAIEIMTVPDGRQRIVSPQ